LQLDEADDFFRHAFLLTGDNALLSSPGLTTHLKSLVPSREAPNNIFQICQVFSTWLNSNSTGVARPKIVTDTRILLRS